MYEYNTRTWKRYDTTRLNTLRHYNWTHSTQALNFGDNPQVLGWLRNSYAEFS